MRQQKRTARHEARTEGRGVQSVEMAARLLSVLAEEAEPMMLRDLAQAAGFASAQAHPYLVSLRNIGLVEQNPETGKYLLGEFALDLAATRMRTTDPMRLAHEAVRDLAAETELNVALVVWGSFGPTVIEVHASGGQLNMNTRPGTVYSMSGTASGKVFSTFLPEKTVRDAIQAEKREKGMTGRVGVHRFLSKKELDDIRRAGYATVDTPPVPGINAIAAPVFDHAGQLVLVITIIGLEELLHDRADREFVPALVRTTQNLSGELGFSPGRSV